MDIAPAVSSLPGALFPAVADPGLLPWAGFAVLVLVILAFDLGVLHRGQRTIGTREALALSAFYIALALAFNAWLAWQRGLDAGLAFLTAYLIEKSLSLDNIFVIAVIFSALAIPRALQHRVLFWGVLGALAMRLVLVLAGTTLIQSMHSAIYLLGGMLVLSGIRMLTATGHPPNFADGRIARFLRRHLRLTADCPPEGGFLVRRDGRLFATPLLLALLLVEMVDLVFAIDSVPAVIAITPDPFIVYTSNIFAILGLRSLYFALAGILGRFVYLNYGLALVLVLAGAKMALADLVTIPTLVTLAATLGVIGGSILASLWWPGRRGAEHA